MLLPSRSQVTGVCVGGGAFCLARARAGWWNRVQSDLSITAGSMKLGMGQGRSVMRTETLELKVRVELSGMDQKGGVVGIAAARATVPPHSWPRCPAKRSCLGRAGFKYPKVRWTGQAQKAQGEPRCDSGQDPPLAPC